jgi:outer membrane autotransporter protein
MAIGASKFVINAGGSFSFTTNTSTVNVTAVSSEINDGGKITFNHTTALRFSGDLEVNDGGRVDFANGTANVLEVFGAFKINSGGTVSLAANGQINGATINSAGTIELGANTLTIGGAGSALTFDNGSTIDFSYDGTSQGVIRAANTMTATFKDGAKINLVPYANDATYWTTGNKILVNAGAGSGSIVDPEKINAGFYNLFVDPANPHLLRVRATKNAYEQVASSAGLEISPNIRSGSALMQDIAVASGTVPDLLPLSQKLESIVTAITQNYPTALAEAALKQLVGESVVGLNSAVSTTVLKTQSVVFNRLDRVREIELANLTPPAAGSGSELNRVWVGGFGIWSREDDSTHVSGYEYSGGGVALGYDRKFEGLAGLRLGISAAYSGGKIKNNDGRTSVDLSTIGVGVYGSYILPNGVFFDASVGYANTYNDYATNLIVGGRKTGSFDINSWQFSLRGGVVFHGDNWQIIPSVGVKYVYLRQGAFADTLDAVATGTTLANDYRSRIDRQVDIPIQIKFNTTVKAGSATLTPELRLGYTFAVRKLDNAMEVGFVGAPGTAKIVGTRARGDSLQAGVSLKINTGGVVDFFVNYDLDASNGYHSHNASLGMGFEF